jgi:hypothetical protein
VQSCVPLSKRNGDRAVVNVNQHGLLPMEDLQTYLESFIYSMNMTHDYVYTNEKVEFRTDMK